jgi:hypothetical protein
LTKGYIVTTRDERSFPRLPGSTLVTGEADPVPTQDDKITGHQIEPKNK